MAADLAISVVVCTRNRAASLGRLLKSLTTLAIPEGIDWEVIVVDNDSRDETGQVVASFEAALPVRRVIEPRIGLASARNAGMRAAAGTYLCWTDDDVLVPPGWLQTYWQAFHAHPEAAVFGGPIIPQAEPPHTAWFVTRMQSWPLASVVANRDLGLQEIPLLPQGDRLPWGANFATRRREQLDFPYDPNLFFGEETDVVSRLLKSGASGWWVPAAAVTHMIPANRQSWSYIDSYYRRAGAAAAYLWDRDGLDNPVAAGAPSWTASPGAMLHGAALVAGLLSALARLSGLTGPALRWAARRSYIRGVQQHRVARLRTRPAGLARRAA